MFKIAYRHLKIKLVEKKTFDYRYLVNKNPRLPRKRLNVHKYRLKVSEKHILSKLILFLEIVRVYLKSCNHQYDSVSEQKTTFTLLCENTGNTWNCLPHGKLYKVIFNKTY